MANGGTDTATITVNASGQNDAPTANDDTINVTVGTPATGNVITSSDTDPDSDSLTVSAIAGGSVGSAVTGTYGTFTLNSDGSYTYTVDTTNSDVIAWQSGDAVLTETFTYTVSDGNGGTDTATITVNASGQNDAPTANDDTINVTVGTPATGNVITSSDTDPDSDSLTVSAIAGGSVGSAVTGTYGTFTLNSDGSYTYTVDTTNSDVIAWQSGDAVLTETFTYTVSDGNGGTDTATITVNASGQNDAPTANDDTINVTVGTPATGNVITSSDTDPDSDSLTVSAIAGGSVGSAVTGTYGTFTLNSDGSYTYTVDTTNSDVIAWQSGDAVLTETFTYTVSDGNGGTDTATITVNASGQNDAPTANDDTINVTVGTPATGNVITSSDTDPDSDSLTVSAIAGGSVGSAVTGTYGTFTLNSDGSYTYTVDTTNSDVIAWQSGDAVLTETFTYTVSDGNGGTDTATITVNASGQNDAPTANDDTINVTVGTPATGNVITSSDTDPDSDSLTVSAIAGGSVGSAVTGTYGTFTLNSDGSYTYTVDTTNSDVIAWQSGDAVLTETFTYTVSDGNGGTDTATITVNASGQNDAPTANDDTDSVTEGGTVIETTNSQGTVLSDDSDVDGDSLTVSGTVSQTSATANGGSSITISSPNSASVGSAVTGYYGQLTLDSDGTYSYVANQSTANALDDSESGTDVFTFTVSDGTTTTSSTITITVNGQNDAPTANDDTINVTVGTPATGNVITSSDTDPDSDSLTVSAIAGGSVGSAVTGTYGTFTLNSDGSYTYTVDTTNSDVIAWQSGDAVLTETFTYTVSDGTATDTATITVNASGQNDAPTANDDTINVTVGTPATGNVITSSDTDPDSDSLTVSAIAGGSVGSAVTGTYGTFTLNSDGSYTYTVDTTNSDVIAWQSGDAVLTETFTYTVSDGNGGTDTATITVNASGQNDAPTANDDTINVTVGTPATGNVITSSDTDPDSDSLTVSAIAGGSVGSAVTGTYGTFTLNSDGSYTYTVDTTNSDVIAWQSGDAVLTETFTYTVSDGTATDTATITVNASGQNDAPTANDDTINVTVGTPATGNVITSSDTDPDSDSLTVSAIAGGSVGSAVTGTYGTFTLNSDGSYTYTVDTTNSDVIAWQSGDAVLTETFTYTVSDGNGGTDTATITVNASGQNDAPTANDDTINVTVGTPATGNVITSSDTDPDSDSLTVSAIAGGSVGSAVTGTYGTFTLNSDGSYTYTVDTTNSDVIAWQSGDAVLTETFTYTVSDGTCWNRHCNNYC